MAFSYVQGNGPVLSGLNYGDDGQSANNSQVDYSGLNQQQSQQQGQGVDPLQAYKMYQQFAKTGPASTGSTGSLFSTGSAGGLGGSGLIGSAGGATSAAANGGASFGLGGSLVGGTGTVGGSTFAAGAGGSEAAAGGAAAGGGSAAGGAAAAAGPWAALAAIIMLNEEDSRKKGLRAENRGERGRDMLTGKVLTQDIEGKWGPLEDKWTGGQASKLGLVGDQKGASQVMSGRIGPGLKSMWNEGTLSKIRKLF